MSGNWVLGTNKGLNGNTRRGLTKPLLSNSMVLLTLVYLTIGSVLHTHAAQLPTGFGPCEGAGCPANYGPTNSSCGVVGSDAGFSVFVGGDFTVSNNGPAEAEGVIAVGGNFTMNRPVLSGNYNIGVAGLGSCVTAPTGTTHMFVGGTVLPGAGPTTGNTIIGALGVTGNTELGTTPSDHNFSYCAGCNELPLNTTIPNYSTFVSDQINNLDDISQCLNDFDVSADATVFQGFYQGQFGAATMDCSSSFNSADGSCAAGIYIIEIENPAANPTDIDFGFVAELDTSAFNDDGSTTIIVNVNDSSGGATPISVRLQPPFPAGNPRFARNMLWNFHNAGQVNIEGGIQFNGTTLVPNGDMEFRGSGANGRTIVGGNLLHDQPGSEMHNYDFLGEVPDACVTPPPCHR